MRSSLSVLICLGLAACGSVRNEESPYVKPNQLMGREIQDRISQIPYQQREELVANLMWLSQSGEQAIPALLGALDSDNAKVRSNVLWVLGRIRDRRTIPSMQPLVQDSDDTVRLEAARTLVTMGDLQHTPLLIDGLDSDHIQVRYLCHAALRQATGREFGYDHLDEDLVSRQHAAYRWRKWWADQSGDPWFAKDYASDRGLDVVEAENGWGVGTSAAPGGETEPPQDDGIEVIEVIEVEADPVTPRSEPNPETNPEPNDGTTLQTTPRPMPVFQNDGR